MSAIKRLFTGSDGLRHGWRFLIFVAVFVLLVQITEQPALTFLGLKTGVDLNQLSASSLILSDLFDLIMILIVTAVFALFERRRIDGYGLPISQAFGPRFWNGGLAGLVTISFVGAGMLVTGGMKIHGLALHGIELVAAALW